MRRFANDEITRQQIGVRACGDREVDGHSARLIQSRVVEVVGAVGLCFGHALG